MILAPVLSSLLFSKGAKEWKNPVMEFLRARYRRAVTWAIHHHGLTIGVGVTGLVLAIYLAFGGVIGSEFLPHLDEGALWVRGELDQSAGPSEGIRVANEARILLCSFPEATDCTSQTGRPDDGTDHTGFFNTEYFVGLKPKGEWRPIFHQNKDNLIAAMNLELTEKIPGVSWGFSQPIEDNMEEAVSGVKGELATKVYGEDLHTLEDKANQIAAIMSHVRGISDLGVLNVTGQPDLNYVVDRQAAARWQINVADIQDAIRIAVGGTALTQVLRGEEVYNLTLRYLPQYRDTREAIDNIRLLSPSGERVSLAQLCTVREADEGSEIYRENNQRYVAIKYSVRNRALGDAVREAIQKVDAQVKLPRGYHIAWEGEYQSEVRAEARMLIIVPLTVLLIFIILYSMYKSFKWAILILATVAMASIGGLLVLLITRTNFSVSSEVGFLALFGVSVQTGVIMLEYINQLRARGNSIEDAAVEGAVLRLRPIMMTMLVATLGLLPAALSHGIGSDSQRPFAIVIVGGLIADLVMSIFLLPTLYVWMARESDVLPLPGIDSEI
jgi:cobalt-zinc-cadmium resistance protein CzcA